MEIILMRKTAIALYYSDKQQVAKSKIIRAFNNKSNEENARTDEYVVFTEEQWNEANTIKPEDYDN